MLYRTFSYQSIKLSSLCLLIAVSQEVTLVEEIRRSYGRKLAIERDHDLDHFLLGELVQSQLLEISVNDSLEQTHRAHAISLVPVSLL